MEKKEMATRLEDLDVEGVVNLLVKSEIEEFVQFVEEKQIDGRKLLEVTEGIVKLWRPRANAKKLIDFINDVKLQPDKHLKLVPKKEPNKTRENNTFVANTEAQYQTVNVKRIKEQITTTSLGVEEILKRIVPPKSFLYRNQIAKQERVDKPMTSYAPMNAGTPKKPRKFFRTSSYEYPHFDLKTLRLSKAENFNDRGYYSVKTDNKFYIQKTYKCDSRTKYKSLSTAEELEKYPEEHFYEDLNYNDSDKEQNDIKELKIPQSSVKPCIVKIQEMFSSFKLPFFKKVEEVERERKTEDKKNEESESDGHIYENSDSVASMYDSIHVNTQEDSNTEKQTQLPVEDYLEPVQLNKDYCDVATRSKDDSILSYILNIFENFSLRRGNPTSKTVSECALESVRAYLRLI